jgi:hypothetical protein
MERDLQLLCTNKSVTMQMSRQHFTPLKDLSTRLQTTKNRWTIWGAFDNEGQGSGVAFAAPRACEVGPKDQRLSNSLKDTHSSPSIYMRTLVPFDLHEERINNLCENT